MTTALSSLSSRARRRPRAGRLFGSVAANFGGQAWAALVTFAAIPVYIDRLGMEAFGLIGVYITLRGLLRLLDLGMTPAVNRHLARLAGAGGDPDEARDFARTFAWLFLAAGIAVLVAVELLAPLVAEHWLRPGSLAPGTVARSLAWMGVLCGLQWPISFSHGALMGLERQPLYNLIKAVENAFTHGGGVLVLVLVSPRVEALLAWHALGALLLALALARAARCALPRGTRAARWRPSLAREVARFAAGMTGISLSAAALMQVDRVLLSRLAGLDAFGRYSLAVFVAGSAVTLVITPIFNAIFPRFSNLWAAGREKELVELYHFSAQLMASAVLPVSLGISFFARPLLEWWTGDPATAASVAPVLSLYVIGTGLNGLMNPPYAIQLAAGWTRIGWCVNLALIALFVPLAAALVPRYGPLACAGIWTALMGIYLAIGVPLTHARYLKGEAARFWRGDVSPALAAAVAGLGSGALLLGAAESARGRAAVALAAIGLSALLAGAASPLVRRSAVAALAGFLRGPEAPEERGAPEGAREEASAVTAAEEAGSSADAVAGAESARRDG